MKPEPKVAAGGIAGAATVVLVWALGQFGVDVPAEVGAALSALIAFAAGYLKSP
jgi:hypothetical protein